VWLTGLPASGKTTLALELQRRLLRRGLHAYVLDGDLVRATVCGDLGFSRRDRDENVRRLASMAARLVRDRWAVVVAAVSPYRRARAEAKASIGRCLEVFVRCSLEVCARRDPKGMYARAFAGELPGFTGISDPYEEPEEPDVEVRTDFQPPGKLAEMVLARLEAVDFLPKLDKSRNPFYHCLKQNRNGSAES
jgi:adenylylsulfate kinase